MGRWARRGLGRLQRSLLRRLLCRNGDAQQKLCISVLVLIRLELPFLISPAHGPVLIAQSTMRRAAELREMEFTSSHT